MKSAKSKIAVAVITLMITGFIVYAIFNFFGADNPGADETIAARIDLRSDDILEDGIYDGTAAGYGGDVTTRITVKDGKIIKVEVVDHNETPEYFNVAVRILEDIIRENTYDVDTVSGCTVTSNAIKDGVHKAMLKARGKSVEQVKDSNKQIRAEQVNFAPGNTPALSIPKNLKDGIYYGYGNGYNGTIKVSVEIMDGRIKDIRVLSHSEDSAYFNKAVAVINRMKNGSSKVDTVAGATITSRGLINAVNNALSKAGAKTDIVVRVPEAKPEAGTEENKEPDFDHTKKLKDGVYFAEANGYAVLVGKDNDQVTFPDEQRIPVRIRLTIKDSKIYSIDVVSHNETPEYFEASRKVIDDFLAGKEKIDTVTGATLTSSALKTAVKDALRQAGQQDDRILEYSDGIWYGQAYGFYTFDKWHVTESDEAWKTQTNVSVEIKDGMIQDVKLIHFGDDVLFEDKLVSKDAFNLIAREVVRTNGVESAVNKFVLNKTSSTGEDTDAISGATFSGNAYINAIADALARSVKYTNEKTDQPIKYIRILPHQDNGHDMSLPYGKSFNVGNFRVKVGYTKNGPEEMKEEIMLLKDAVKMGIEFDKNEFPGIDENLIFTPMPEDLSDYTTKNNYDLKITDPVSGAKALYKGIQGTREYETISIKEVIVTGPEGKKVNVSWKNPEEFKQKYEMPFRASDVKAIEVVDQNGDTAKLNIQENARDDIQKNGFGVRQNQPNILRIEILNPENAKESPMAYYYKFKSIQLEFVLKYNPQDVRTIKVTSEPAVKEYSVGENLNLAGLKVQLVDSNNMTGEMIPFEKFADNGIIVKDAVNGEILNTVGEKTINLEKTVGDRVVKGSFKIMVNEEEGPSERVETSVRFYDLRSGRKNLIAETQIPKEGFAKMGIPAEYFNQGKELADPKKYNWVIADQTGREFKPKAEMPFAFTNNTMMVYREGADGAKMVRLFVEERVETSVRFYDIREQVPRLIAETRLPESGMAAMEIPEEYFVQGKELANAVKYKWVIADQNGKEFIPKAEMPFAFTSNTMMVYREGADGARMVKLSAAKPVVRVDTAVRFYDLTGTTPKLIKEADINEDGKVDMVIPDEYFQLGNQLADPTLYKWAVVDQNGKEFEPNREKPYSLVKTTMLVYREGKDGALWVRLSSDKMN